MALASKKQSNILEKTDRSSQFFITGSKITEMSASFAQADHIQASHYFEENKALLYQLDQMQEEIDELRRYVTNEATGSIIDLKSINTSALPTSVPKTSNSLWVEVNAKTGAKYIRTT